MVVQRKFQLCANVSSAVISHQREREREYDMDLDFIQKQVISYYQKMKIYKALSNQNQDSHDYQKHTISHLSLMSANKWISKEDQITEHHSTWINIQTEISFLSSHVLWIPQVE